MSQDQRNLDAHAQQLGFPNYATWSAWNAKRSAPPSPQQAAPQPAQKPENWLQYIFRQMPNFKMIGDSGEAYRRAQEGK